ncbi:alpha/beta hydrolase [Lactiplantibacillus plantarum]|nr:alpha/beta hydrolase [Lactiplantibacillus plantarum]
MQVKVKWLSGLLVVLLVLGLSGCMAQQRRMKYVQSNTPTLFFHGGGSSYHAEEHMVQAAENAGVTTSVIRAMGLKKGRLQEFVVDS